jgi:hypothetical protein
MDFGPSVAAGLSATSGIVTAVSGKELFFSGIITKAHREDLSSYELK